MKQKDNWTQREQAYVDSAATIMIHLAQANDAVKDGEWYEAHSHYKSVILLAQTLSLGAAVNWQAEVERWA